MVLTVEVRPDLLVAYLLHNRDSTATWSNPTDAHCLLRVESQAHALLMICWAMLLNTLTNIEVSSATTVTPCDSSFSGWM